MKKIICALALQLSVFALMAQTQNKTYLEYIEKYKNVAITEMQNYGIPASITMAQGLLESGAGKSQLTRESNNHFGIKCQKSWTGEKVYHDDDAKHECFRKYRSADESYRDHSDFLRYNDRYKFLFDLESSDYKAWAYGLKKAGYATDPDYAAKLIKLIEDYCLWEYDGTVSAQPSLPESPSRIETPEQLDEKKIETFSFNLTRKLYSLNGVAFVYAEKGDSYASIAGEYHLFKKEILKFNDLSSDAELHPGDIVYLQKKKNKAAKDLDKHVWTDGDDLWKLSQRYAVRLSSLKKLNKGVTSFVEGDLVCLR